jgi:hypothetical protein
VAVSVCALGGLAVGRPPELKFRLDATKCGAEDGGGGLGVPKGRCRRLEAVTFRLGGKENLSGGGNGAQWQLEGGNDGVATLFGASKRVRFNAVDVGVA